MMGPRLSIFLGLLLATSSVQLSAQASFVETTPFVAGQGGYKSYRIPAVVRATNGILLAFCEGRKNSASDSGDIDIVLRRSTDDGMTWQPLTVVQEEGGSASITIGNPSPVVDEDTGRIHLLFCRNNSRVFHTSSVDHGLTWSSRREITTDVKRPEWDWYATGPGHGIQLKRGSQAGRLLVACDHTGTNGVRGAHAVLSDDHGATWRLGGIGEAADGVNPNETLCEELVGAAPGGGSRVYFNARDQGGSAAGTRGQGWSADGGTGFVGAFTNRTSFVCPVVQGALLRVEATDQGGAKNRILFSCPNHPSSRVMLSIWSSTDEALSWSEPRMIYEGPSAYSDMARTTLGEVVLLHERGISSPYETITLARLNQTWLDLALAPAENPGPAFWNFEEKSPGQAASTNAGAIRDVHPAGLNNHLTAESTFSYLAGASAFGTGAAMAFNGTGGLQLSDFQTSNHFDFGATNSFTIEVVFRIPDGSTQTGALVSKDFGTVLPSWWVRVASGRPQFLVSDDAFENAVTAAVSVNDGVWHHLAAVRDTRVPGAKLLRLYVDGALVTNKLDATTGSLANGQPLNIGRFSASASRNLTGEIDMVRITPEALVPIEFLGRNTQFDADADGLPDAFEREVVGSLKLLGQGDRDADGSPDVLEFSLGADPIDPESTPHLSVRPEADSIQASTPQRALPPWLMTQLSSSPDLLSWEPCSGEITLVPISPGLWKRAQTVSYPEGAPRSLFFRLDLTHLP